MSTLTEFRQALADLLSTELGITFIDGMLEGPVEKQDLGCTATVAVAEDDRTSIVAELVEVRVRIFKAFTSRKSPTDAVDPAPFEDLIETVAEIIGSHQTGLGMWFQRVTRAEVDYERHSVTFSVLAETANPSV